MSDAARRIAIYNQKKNQKMEDKDVSRQLSNLSLGGCVEDTLEMSLRDFDFLETLGTGTFGKVSLVRHKTLGKYYAMKQLNKIDVVRLKQVEHTINEKEILISLRNPFIVNLLRTFQDEENLFMLMEYVPGGELFSHLRRVGAFDLQTTIFYASEIVHAFDYMHSKDIIYRDLKPENILLDKTGHVKITDFGFAKRCRDKTWTLCGTPEYLAPEIITTKGHGKGADWWALGILIYEMLAGYPPFFDDSPFCIYEKILAGRIHFPSHFDPVSRDLIKQLLTADLTKRLGCMRMGAEDVKRHKFFEGVVWDSNFLLRRRAPLIPAYRGEGDTSNFEEFPDDPEEEAAAAAARAVANPTGALNPFGHLFKGF
eukprot:GCRY01001547.1.p1 GENE.GCRY01001547.1~~GCRY01001547.1.p1  ORF type:complete len:369 (+),score=53.60 GCRY01001547.1:190-1296(+)